ncbi:Prolipoprotein diacylglyceryl transferase [Mycobacterium basiliense]|uniref:Phosphatidylglycerol--prolipoprotein diacylglyceryl transferase n=1 Tax=Mycobacterium basiliense TaxID=2094119 RepID=A0A447GE32_9MYCO|nr:prolipoprotein diacylglyceryl transferase [Mycobacterium basiliense]VDM88684.1 Prolipoprotein diacylglyceryl transferase [Mycobacterium basiliense]
MTVSWLAYFPSPPRGVWYLGPLPIRAYALFIITGILVALVISDRRFVARGGEHGVAYDIALWMVPLGLIGGRLYHLATDWQTYFGQGGAGFGAALRIWDGGLGIWGAVALGAVGAWIGCRRRGIPLPAFLDAVAPGVVLAQAIGRLGNYFNQELYGRETTLPWGLEIFYRRDPSGFVDVHSLDGVSTGQVAVVVQPTFLYELIWNVLVFAVLIYLDRRFAIGHGRLFGLYVAFYCVGRFCVELLRDDAATHIAGIRINSFTSTFVFIGAVVYVMLAPKGREDPATVRGSTEVVHDAVEFEPAAVASDSAATVAAPTAEADDGSAAEAGESGPDAEVVEPETASAPVEDQDEDQDVVPAEVEASDTDVPEAPETEVTEAGEAEDDVHQAEAEADAEAAEALELDADEPQVASAEATADPQGSEVEPAEEELEPVAGSAEVQRPELAEHGEAEDVAADDAEAEGREAGGDEAEGGEPAEVDPEFVESEVGQAGDVESDIGDVASDVAEPQPEETQAGVDEAATTEDGPAADEVQAVEGDLAGAEEDQAEPGQDEPAKAAEPGHPEPDQPPADEANADERAVPEDAEPPESQAAPAESTDAGASGDFEQDAEPAAEVDIADVSERAPGGDEEETPSPTGEVVPDSADSTRQPWRSRLRNWRRRTRQ